MTEPERYGVGCALAAVLLFVVLLGLIVLGWHVTEFPAMP